MLKTCGSERSPTPPGMTTLPEVTGMCSLEMTEDSRFNQIIKCHKTFVFKIWMKKHLSSNTFFLQQVIFFVCLYFGYLNFVSGEPWLTTPHLGLRSGSFYFRGHWYSFRVSVACYIEPIWFKYLFTQLFIKPTVFQTMCWDVKKHQTWSLASSTFQPGGESRWVMQFNVIC